MLYTCIIVDYIIDCCFADCSWRQVCTGSNRGAGHGYPVQSASRLRLGRSKGMGLSVTMVIIYSFLYFLYKMALMWDNNPIAYTY